MYIFDSPFNSFTSFLNQFLTNVSTYVFLLLYLVLNINYNTKNEKQYITCEVNGSREK